MSETNPPEITLGMMRESLYSAVVCDALDSLGYPHQSPRLPIVPMTGDALLVGRCRTTLWVDYAYADPQPYEMELLALDAAGPDDVLIAAAGGSMRSGIWGELLTHLALNAGAVGAIVDGAVRDVTKFRAMPFRVWARGTCVYDSKDRQKVVEMDQPVLIGETVFGPGDLVFADADGIVVVPKAIEAEAIRAAWDKVHRENEVRDAIKSGMKAKAVYDKYQTL